MVTRTQRSGSPLALLCRDAALAWGCIEIRVAEAVSCGGFKSVNHRRSSSQVNEMCVVFTACLEAPMKYVRVFLFGILHYIDCCSSLLHEYQLVTNLFSNGTRATQYLILDRCKKAQLFRSTCKQSLLSIFPAFFLNRDACSITYSVD